MYGQVTMMNKQDDTYIPPPQNVICGPPLKLLFVDPPLKLLFVEGIIRVFLPDKTETFLLNGYNRTDMYT